MYPVLYTIYFDESQEHFGILGWSVYCHIKHLDTGEIYQKRISLYTWFMMTYFSLHVRNPCWSHLLYATFDIHIKQISFSNSFILL